MFTDLLGNPIFFVLSMVNSAIVSAIVTCWIKDGCKIPSFRLQMPKRYRVQKARQTRRKAEPISPEMWCKLAKAMRKMTPSQQREFKMWLKSQNGSKIHTHGDLIRQVYASPPGFREWLRTILAPAGLMATRPAFAFATA